MEPAERAHNFFRNHPEPVTPFDVNQLVVLDRQIAETYERVLKSASKRSAGDLRKTQRDFLTTRNASFGRPGYDLRKVMQDRLQRLNALES